MVPCMVPCMVPSICMEYYVAKYNTAKKNYGTLMSTPLNFSPFSFLQFYFNNDLFTLILFEKERWFLAWFLPSAWNTM